jgi:hypothetical protein
MKFMQRISRGTEAGLIAGTVVALVFFVSDLVHLTPLAPPAALANALMADPPAGVDLPMAASMTGAVVLAAGVVVYRRFTSPRLLCSAWWWRSFCRGDPGRTCSAAGPSSGSLRVQRCFLARASLWDRRSQWTT